MAERGRGEQALETTDPGHRCRVLAETPHAVEAGSGPIPRPLCLEVCSVSNHAR